MSDSMQMQPQVREPMVARVSEPTVQEQANEQQVSIVCGDNRGSLH